MKITKTAGKLSIDKVVKFLSNPQIKGTVQMKVKFLKEKGLTDNEITEALDIASGGEVLKSAFPRGSE